MRSAMIVIVTAFLVLFAEFADSAPQAGDTLRGTIKVKENGAPAVVWIRLEKSGVTIQEGFPRENRFEFRNVAAGRYTLIAEAPGYVTVQQEIQIPGEWPQLELVPRRDPIGPAVAVPAWSLQIPQSARREFITGTNKLLENNCADAIEHLKKAVRRYAGFGDAHRAMGECYFQMNQLDGSESEFKQALEQPHLPDLHLLLGKVYGRQGNRGLLMHQLELFVEEEKPGPRRDKAIAAIEAQ